MYQKQLNAYHWALEHPIVGMFGVSPISEMGLYVYNPDKVSIQPSTVTDYIGRTTWIDFQFSDQQFLSFMAEVVTVMEMSSAPPPTKGCQWCANQKQTIELYKTNPEYFQSLFGGQ
jgi:hypothetical protein